jgi:hypothetical protein
MATAHPSVTCPDSVTTPTRATPDETPRDALSWAALTAAIGVTAYSEWQLGVAAGFGPIVAAGIPAALDIYALRAMRAHRDVPAVVGAMIAVNAMSHLVSTGLAPVTVPLVVAVSAIAPLVFWRVHRLARPAATKPATGNPAPDDSADEQGDDTPERPEYDNELDRLIRDLYETLGARPVTAQMTAAMKAAGLGDSGSSARSARSRIETREPHLRDLPSARIA